MFLTHWVCVGVANLLLFPPYVLQQQVPSAPQYNAHFTINFHAPTAVTSDKKAHVPILVSPPSEPFTSGGRLASSPGSQYPVMAAPITSVQQPPQFPAHYVVIAPNGPPTTVVSRPPMIQRTIHRHEMTRNVPLTCPERTIRKVTQRRRRIGPGGKLSEWEVVIKFYEVRKDGSLVPISREEAERCSQQPTLPHPTHPGPVPPPADENDDEEEEAEQGEEREAKNTAGQDEEEDEPDENEDKNGEAVQKAAESYEEPVARLARIPTFPVTEKNVDFSDPQNRGKRWCWKLIHPATMHHNVGYLVHHSECLKNKGSLYYQETHDSTVCVEKGGILIKNMPCEGTSLPYKIACITRYEALRTKPESCWAIQKTYPNLILQRVPDVLGDLDNPCSLKRQPWPFYDRKHISSRFDTVSGGIAQLYHCNRFGVTQASVLYQMAPDGKITGFAETFCDPPPPIPTYACSGVAFHCFYYLPPSSM